MDLTTSILSPTFEIENVRGISEALQEGYSTPSSEKKAAVEAVPRLDDKLFEHDYDKDWDPRASVPPITIIGRSSRLEQETARSLRERMIDNLTYWKKLGLPNPPDLKGIVYIPTYEDLTLRQVLSLMNPDIPDLAAHIHEQYSHLKTSYLSGLLRWVEESVHLEEGFLQNKVFDFYVQIRFGFSIGNCYEAIRSNKTLGQLPPADVSKMQDNAYKGLTLKVDLTDLLPTAESHREKINPFDDDLEPTKLMNAEMFKISFRTKSSPVIVLLPRTTQKVGDHDISTLFAEDVAIHEQGHHMIDTAARGWPVHRLIHEVIADYVAARLDGDPRIGERFVDATRIVADRLFDGTIDQFKLGRRMARVGEKEALRDMSLRITLEDINRGHILADAYSGGNPLRNFLWELREKNDAHKDEIHSLILKSLQEFSKRPAYMSDRTKSMLLMREAWTEVKKHIWMGARALSLKYVPAIPFVSAPLSLMFPSNPFFVYRTEKEMFKHNSLTECYEYAKFANSIRTEMNEIESHSRRRLWHFLGAGFRPAVEADYVTAEFLRSFHRAAKDSSPELKKSIRKEAERVMRASSRLVPLSDGSEELVFMRSPLDRLNVLARSKIKAILEEANGVRREIERVGGAQHPFEDCEDSAPRGEGLKKLMKKFGRSIEPLLEYERTGLSFTLWFPHPIRGTAAWIGNHVLKPLFTKFIEKRFLSKIETYVPGVKGIEPLTDSLFCDDNISEMEYRAVK